MFDLLNTRSPSINITFETMMSIKKDQETVILNGNRSFYCLYYGVFQIIFNPLINQMMSFVNSRKLLVQDLGKVPHFY